MSFRSLIVFIALVSGAARADAPDYRKLGEDAKARAACAGLDCNAAINSADYDKVCSITNAWALRDAALFCDQERKVVNPFAVAALKTDQSSAAACRMYMLSVAHVQASERLKQSTQLSESEQDVLTLGSYLYVYENDCLAAKAVGAEATPPPELKSILENLSATNAESYAYCKQFADSCADLNGVAKNIGGKERCVSGGIVFDESCLRQAPNARAALKKALSTVGGHGVSCLKRLGSGARTLGERLDEHVKGEKPRTQICCGDQGCLSSVFRNYKKSSPEQMAVAGAIADGADETGTIEVPGRGLMGAVQLLEENLFHEFMHRVGVCRNPNHNAYAMPLVAFVDKNRRCPKGYAKTDIAKLAEQTGLKEGRIRTMAKLQPTVKSSSRDSGFVCVLPSSCNKSKPLIAELPPALHDPVYACAGACFPSASKREAETLGVMYESSTREQAEQICRGFGAADPTWSGDRFGKIKGTVNGQAKAVCALGQD